MGPVRLVVGLWPGLLGPREQGWKTWGRRTQQSLRLYHGELMLLRLLLAASGPGYQA